MKKLKKIIVTVLAATLVMSVSAFAATADDVKAKLTAAGVTGSYNDQVATYLTDHPITDAQADGIIANIDQLNTIAAGRTDAAAFTEAEKTQIKGLVQTTASSVGLTVTTNGTEIFILDSKGNSVGKSTIADFVAQAPNFNAAAFKEAVQAAKEYSETLTGSTQAQATALKKTATNNGNVLVVGLGVLALAGCVFVASKKVTA
jgi:hypothetical protein